MKKRTRCSCPLLHNECDYTEEFNNLIKEGWEIEKAWIDSCEYCVRFILTKEYDENA